VLTVDLTVAQPSASDRTLRLRTAGADVKRPDGLRLV